MKKLLVTYQGDFETVDLTEDSKGDKKDPYEGANPYSFQ
jgi:hypothetical protein